MPSSDIVERIVEDQPDPPKDHVPHQITERAKLSEEHASSKQNKAQDDKEVAELGELFLFVNENVKFEEDGNGKINVEGVEKCLQELLAISQRTLPA